MTRLRCEVCDEVRHCRISWKDLTGRFGFRTLETVASNSMRLCILVGVFVRPEVQDYLVMLEKNRQDLGTSWCFRSSTPFHLPALE